MLIVPGELPGLSTEPDAMVMPPDTVPCSGERLAVGQFKSAGQPTDIECRTTGNIDDGRIGDDVVE